MLHILAWFSWYFGPNNIHEADNNEESRDNNVDVDITEQTRYPEIFAQDHIMEQRTSSATSTNEDSTAINNKPKEYEIIEDDIEAVDLSPVECNYVDINDYESSQDDSVFATPSDYSKSKSSNMDIKVIRQRKVTLKSEPRSGRIHSIVVKDKNDKSSNPNRIRFQSEGEHRYRSTTK